MVLHITPRDPDCLELLQKDLDAVVSFYDKTSYAMKEVCSIMESILSGAEDLGQERAVKLLAPMRAAVEKIRQRIDGYGLTAFKKSVVFQGECIRRLARATQRETISD